MKIKVLSPIVATIILILLTIALAGMLGAWVTFFVRTKTVEINQTMETARVNCFLMKFDIVSCRKQNDNIKIILSNSGMTNISGLMITFFELDDMGNIINLNSTEIKKNIIRASYEILDIKSLLRNFSKIEIKSIECPDVRSETYC